MNLNNSTCGRLVVDLEGQVLTAEERELLLHPAIGGLILFSRNYANPSQLADLVGSIRELAPSLLLTVDQEGGRVQRLREGFTRLPPLHSFAARYAIDADDACALARDCGWLMAAEVVAAGLDLSFAPVLDVYSVDSQVIADRAFSADVDILTDLALAYIDGMHEAGMAATGKHFPGHGSVVADSHVELPEDTRSAAAIVNYDYQVFVRCCAHLQAIMPAHVRYPAIDDECAGFSRVWLMEKLRGELGFDGVIFSDDLSMVAAHSAGSIEARLEKALAAGCDVALVCNDRSAALAACRWAEQQNLDGSERFARLRAKPKAVPADFKQQDRWQHITERLSDTGV